MSMHTTLLEEDDEVEYDLQQAIEESSYDYAQQLQLEEFLESETYLELLQQQSALNLSESTYVGYSSNSNASSSNTHTQVYFTNYVREVGKDDLKGNESKPPVKETCKICLEDKESSEFFINMVCFHNFCSNCILLHIRSKLQEKLVPIDCAEPNCSEHLTPEQCQQILPIQILEEWPVALIEADIPISERFYCPFRDCSALLWKEIGIKESECPECRRLFCAQCHVPWHAGLDCSEWESLSPFEKEKDDIMLFNLAKEKEWKRCTKCRQIVEKTSGCDHITCRCGYQFCYICGSEWKGDIKPCNCKGW